MRRMVLPIGASVVIGGLALVLAQAQDRGGPGREGGRPAAEVPAPAAAQEKVRLPVVLESWYKIFAGDEHVGFASVLVQTGGRGAARYRYNTVSEMEILVPDPQDAARRVPTLRTVSIEASLDDTFAPIEMVWRITESSGEKIVESTHTVTQVEAGRRLDVQLPDGSHKQFTIRADVVDLYYTPHLMFLVMRQNDLLSRVGFHNAKILVPRHEEAPVADVQFDVKGAVQREYMGKKATVTRVEWIKPPPAVSADLEAVDAFIDKYGRVVEETLRGGMRFVLVKGKNEAEGEAASLRLRGRTCPFRKDMAMVLQPGEKAGPREAKGPEVQLDNLDKGLESARALLEDLKKSMERKDETGARDKYDQIVKFVGRLRELSAKDPSPEKRKEIEDIKAQAEKLYGGVDRILQKARGIFVKAAEEHFERGDLKEMEAALKELVELEKRPEIAGDERLATLRNYARDLEPLIARCRTRLELARRKLTLSGVTLHLEEKAQVMDIPLMVFGHAPGVRHQVRFILATDFALINDKLYKVGDFVEEEKGAGKVAGKGIRVEKIWKYGVQVSLGEETREVPFRQ